VGYEVAAAKVHGARMRMGAVLSSPPRHGGVIEMRNDVVQTLVDRWENDMDFRELMRKDPNRAVQTTGMELTEDEWAAIRKIDWKQTDAELQERISKQGNC